MKIIPRMVLAIFVFLFFTSYSHADGVKGIYLTQNTLENTAYLNSLIRRAKAVGIDTFVIDMERPSKRYSQNIDIVLDNDIKYVARVVMFPGGGTREQVKNPAVWQKKYALMQRAIELGASEIQLDYIRYNTKQKPSSDNAKDILAIIQWYKHKLSGQGISLQVDIFGVASFGESKYIGQNIKLFSQSVDAICPMVYPSHYSPYAHHYATPYETIYDSLTSIRDQFDQDMPVKMYAYIELSNYHYRMSREQRLVYINKQLNAVEAADAHGWYAWSPHNRYDHLFTVLESRMNNKKPQRNQAAS